LTAQCSTHSDIFSLAVFLGRLMGRCYFSRQFKRKTPPLGESCGGFRTL
jgi:hypothetical protein